MGHSSASTPVPHRRPTSSASPVSQTIVTGSNAATARAVAAQASRASSRRPDQSDSRVGHDIQVA
jgi:hypothetical protein